jgi:hypothetical protein
VVYHSFLYLCRTALSLCNFSIRDDVKGAFKIAVDFYLSAVAGIGHLDLFQPHLQLILRSVSGGDVAGALISQFHPMPGLRVHGTSPSNASSLHGN